MGQTLPFGLELLLGGEADEAASFVQFLTTELAESAGSRPCEWRGTGSVEVLAARDATVDAVVRVLTRPVWLGMVERTRRWSGFSTLEATLAPLRGGLDASGDRTLPIARLPRYAGVTPREYAEVVERKVNLVESRSRLFVPAPG